MIENSLGHALRTTLVVFLLILPLGLHGAMTSRFNEPYPSAPSKKGLQVEIVDDALALGVKHAALNFNVTSLIDLAADTNTPSWEAEGRKFHFRRDYLAQTDGLFKSFSDKCVLVNLIVLSYSSGLPEFDKVILHPDYAPTAPNFLGAFNTTTEEGRAWFVALME